MQNAAAGLISSSSRYYHITSFIMELHWLPVEHRKEFKIMLVTYKALHAQTT